MQIENYFSQRHGRIIIDRDQASNFAKNEAYDFNPIHDMDNPHFCVPGDLLFALVLANYGLSEHISFAFVGMATDAPLIFPENPGEEFSIAGEDSKEYLQVKRRGNPCMDPGIILRLTKNYVAFSGQNFPDLLVPLMTEHHVMINAKRPMVIYQNMSIDLQTFEFNNPQLELAQSSLNLRGKKAQVELNFLIKADKKIVGTGVKHLLLRGLREYEQASVDSMVNAYNQLKQGWG